MQELMLLESLVRSTKTFLKIVERLGLSGPRYLKIWNKHSAMDFVERNYVA